MEWAWYYWVGIAAIGVIQGFFNTIAGGGSLLVLPALTFLGMDISVANGTNRIAILLQSISGASEFRKRKVLSLRAAIPLAGASTAGAGVGTFLAIQADQRLLRLAVAALISIMAVLLVARPGMWERTKTVRWPKPCVYALFFAIGVYGGFIQAGVGFFFTWALVMACGTDLVRGNAIKTIIIGAYTLVSLTMFLVSGLVHVPVGLVLAGGSMMGARMGARFTVVKGNRWVRWVLAVVVVASAARMICDAL